MEEKKLSKNRKKRWPVVILYMILGLFSLLLIAGFVFRQPFVQAYVLKKVSTYVAGKTHTQLGFQSVRIDLFRGVRVRGLYLKDTLNEKMVYVGLLQARPELLELLSGNFRFRSVRMDTLDFFLINPKGASDYSFIKFVKELESNDTTPSTTPPKPFKLVINNINLQHVHFRLKDDNVHDTVGPHTIDFSNLNVYDATIKARNFHLTDDSMHFALQELSGREQSGFVIKKLSTDMSLGPHWFVFKNVKAKTNHSFIQADYTMHTNSWDTYSYYIDSVRMTVHLGPSVLDMTDLGYFSGEMFNMPDVLHIEGGSAKGTVAALRATDLDVRFGKASRFYGNVGFTGLPDFYNSYISARIKDFKTSAADLSTFAYPGDSAIHIHLPSLIGSFRPVTITGKFQGYYEDFATSLELKPEKQGLMTLNLAVKTHNNHLIRLGLDVHAEHFPLDEVLNTNGMLADVDMDGNVRMEDLARKGVNNIHFNIKKLSFNGYDYKNIRYAGSLVSDTLHNTLTVLDPNLGMKLSGNMILGEQPEYDFHLNLTHSDFTELNWWNEKNFHLKTRATIHFTGNNLTQLAGFIHMKNTDLQFGKQTYPVEDIIVSKARNLHDQIISFRSDIMNWELSGDYEVTELGTILPHLFHQYYAGIHEDTLIGSYRSNNLLFKLRLLKPELIGEQFVPGLSISRDAFFEASMNFRHPSVFARAYASDISYQGIDMKDNRFQVRSQNKALNVEYRIRHLILKDSTHTDKSVFGMDSLAMNMRMDSDTLNFGMNWKNLKSQWRNTGRVDGYYVQGDSTDLLRISKSKVYVNDTLWHMDPRNRMIRKNNSWKFEHFLVNGGQSQVLFQGTVPEHTGDSLEVSFRNWNLSNLALLWKYLGFDLSGTLNGYVNLSKRGEGYSPVANLTVDKLSLNRSPMGTAYVLSTWDNVNNSAFIKAQVINKTVFPARNFGLDGFYYPYRNQNQFDLTGTFDQMKLRGANRFLREYVTNLKGKATGKVHLTGSFRQPELTGAVSLDTVSMVVNYLNTKYSFYHNQFVFNKNYIDFGKFRVYDTLGNYGELQGKLLFHYFRDPALDVHLTTNRLLFFNTNQRPDDVYFGTAFASGKVDITGPLDNITLDLNVQSDNGTSVVLPLDYSTELSDKDFIVFEQPKDTVKNKKKETVLNLPAPSQSQYQINLNMGVRPSANLKIYLPSAMGTIESQGEGELNLNLNSAGDVNLAGDYIVDKGSLNFTLGDFVRKHLELVKGGRISWSGDPYKATVNIKGLYKLKADLSTLGLTIDSTAAYKNRVNVNCYVVLSHELFNPEISFQITFPDMDPDMRRQVYAQLDTTNQALMNQEMISLLVLGTFTMSDAVKVDLTSSYYKILSNQLSSLLSRISKDFDVGLNYKPGDNISKEEFDVALSTQLFDNRLMINGNFGMSYDRQNRQASNLVGDVDIGYKLTKDGRWLLKVYNHSNVNSWYYYSNYDKISPYTQGVGIAYRKSFDNLAELFGRKKKPVPDKKKKKKDKAEDQTTQKPAQ
ncbi:MAG: translocation/assembly module TamB domain-containing protein [Bacteroidales bacterium]|nr:translocation/assembly module TamB domain-containing protein [Bacteroidales bacterium]